MLTLTKNFAEQIEKTAKQMIENNLSEAKIKKENTNISMTLLRSKALTDENITRVISSHTIGEELFYLAR